MNDTQKIWFSVIIPVYNRPDLLKRAVESVQKQTFSEWECHIIDDGSFNLHPYYKNFSNSNNNDDKRIYYHYFSKNRGVSWARNQGFRQARGEWIAFLDSDDEWLPEKLAEAKKFIKQNRDLKIFQTKEIWIRNGRRVNPPLHLRKQSGNIFQKSLEHCLITTSSVVIHRSLLDKNYFWDEKIPACEDYDLWLQITAEHKIGLLPNLLTVRYQDYGGKQLSQKYSVMDRFRLYAIKKFIKKSKNLEKKKVALQELDKKSQIVLSGAWKRKNILLWLKIFIKYTVWARFKSQFLQINSNNDITRRFIL